jgi:hypothetical protein
VVEVYLDAALGSVRVWRSLLGAREHSGGTAMQKQRLLDVTNASSHVGQHKASGLSTFF